jgi:Co/Zn/Cd efflux system component
MGNSQALVADAVHSFTDGISDIVTLWAIHMMQVRALKDTFFFAPSLITVTCLTLLFSVALAVTHNTTAAAQCPIPVRPRQV